MNSGKPASRKQKILVAGAIFFTVLISFFAVFYLRAQSKTQDERDIAMALSELINSEKKSFSGTIEVSDKYNYKIKFTSTVLKDSSTTDFEASSPDHLGSAIITGKIINIDNKTYVKFIDVSSQISRLPNNPLSLAIKSNLTPVAEKYQDQWLQLPESEGLGKPSGCLSSLMKISAVQQDLNNAYSESPFINIQSKSQTTVNDKNAVVYDIALNDKAVELLESLGVASGSGIDECLNTEVTFKVTLDKTEKSVVALSYSNDKVKVKADITTNQSSDESSISVPKSSKSFAELEDELQALFLN